MGRFGYRETESLLQESGEQFHKKEREYKCMNCRKPVTRPGRDFYSKRFCSEKCISEYFGDSY